MGAMRRIYLDHHATTPMLPEVVDAMAPFLREAFADPWIAAHREASEAAVAVEEARERVASLVGARRSEIVFTSGATEANNQAIKGSAWARKPGRDRLVTCAIEHPSVLEPAAWAEREGLSRTVLPVDGRGRVDPGAVRRALEAPAFLVSIQLANGEIGTIQAIEEIAGVCGERGSLLHVDAAQAVGRIPVDFRALGADLMSLTAHKLHGPKGAGALVIRRGVRIEALLHGEGQEKGRRSGTVHVAGAVGLGAACAAAAREMETQRERIEALRDRLWEGIREGIPGVRRNGDASVGLPGNLSVTFERVSAEALIQALRTVAVSRGSLGSSANSEPSHVLRAIGLTEEQADSTLRFGLGRGNFPDEIDEVVERLIREVGRMRALSPGA